MDKCSVDNGLPANSEVCEGIKFACQERSVQGKPYSNIALVEATD